MTDYRNYIIQDGRFVGAFEEMYRQCEDPWHQLQRRDPFGYEAMLALMKKHLSDRVPWARILDLGSGLGR